MILMGDLNVDLYGTSPDDRATEIIALVASLGLEDMSSHFLQRKGYCHGDTWHMLRNGQLISSRCDYILATDRKYFKYAGLREPRYNTDHLMVMGEIITATRRENFAYLRGHKRFPLKRNKNTTTMSIADVMFSEFRSLIDTRDDQPAWKSREPWISENTWRLIDQRASRGGNQTMTQAEKRSLNQRIRRSLRKDRKKRTIVAGERIESHLNDKDWRQRGTHYRRGTDAPVVALQNLLAQIFVRWKEPMAIFTNAIRHRANLFQHM
jgi:hypothetical protein